MTVVTENAVETAFLLGRAKQAVQNFIDGFDRRPRVFIHPKTRRVGVSLSCYGRPERWERRIADVLHEHGLCVCEWDTADDLGDDDCRKCEVVAYVEEK